MEIISSDPAATAEKTNLHVLIVYESVLSCLIAKQLCDDISNYSDLTIHNSWCSFKLLQGEEHKHYIRKIAQGSDLIIITKSDKSIIPKHVGSVIDSCKHAPQALQRALLGVVATEENETPEDLPAYQDLKTRASHNGLNFFGLSFLLSSRAHPEYLDNCVTQSPNSEFIDFLRENYGPGVPISEQHKI